MAENGQREAGAVSGARPLVTTAEVPMLAKTGAERQVQFNLAEDLPSAGRRKSTLRPTGIQTSPQEEDEVSDYHGGFNFKAPISSTHSVLSLTDELSSELQSPADFFPASRFADRAANGGLSRSRFALRSRFSSITEIPAGSIAPQSARPTTGYERYRGWVDDVPEEGLSSESLNFVAPDAVVPFDEIVDPFRYTIQESVSQTQPKTIIHLAGDCATKYGEGPVFLLSHRSSSVVAPLEDVVHQGMVFHGLSWQAYYDKAIEFALTLIVIGFAPRQSVNMLVSEHLVELYIVNLGTILAAGVSVILEQGRSTSDYVQVAKDTGASILVVDTPSHLATCIECMDQVDSISAIILLKGTVEEARIPQSGDLPVFTLANFLLLGKEVDPGELWTRSAFVHPDDCAVITYVFPLGGKPFGMQFSHDNITFTASVLATVMGDVNARDRMIGFMPLHDILCQMMEIYLPLSCGVPLALAPGDPFQGTLGATILSFKPTIFFGSPSVYHKLLGKLLVVETQLGALDRNMLASRTLLYHPTLATQLIHLLTSSWSYEEARRSSLRMAKESQFTAIGDNKAGKHPIDILRSRILRKMKRSVGLEHCRVAFSGLAMMDPKDVAHFISLGLPVFEIYSSPQCTGVAALNRPRVWKMGTVGRELPGSVLLASPLSGELRYKGRNVFIGYVNDPSRTQKLFDPHGWLRLGEYGALDKDGCLTLQPTSSSPIILADGTETVPDALETAVRDELPEISHAVVLGDGKPFLVLLLTLKQTLDKDGRSSGTLASQVVDKSLQLGSTASKMEELVLDAKWGNYIDNGIRKANRGVYGSNNHRISKWALLLDEFSREDGELDDHDRVNRIIVQERYKEVIDSLYT